ncbi:MAG: hypothetical protein HY841_01165 [Bacteroidetes bacterium]|nr:hypothetical protein [Bacteroidota bacterium]
MDETLNVSFDMAQKVLYTFIANGIFRSECADITGRGKDCIDTHLESAVKDNKYPCIEKLLFYCGYYGWTKKMSSSEIADYKNMAKENLKKLGKRMKREHVPWEKLYRDLYEN